MKTLVLYLTEDCNLRCSYCFVRKTPSRMTSETARRAVEFFLDRRISGAVHDITIAFFGGEPFLELDRMEEVVSFARQHRPNVYKRISFSATTNGTIWNERVERIIRGTPMSLLVSLDGTPDASRQRVLSSGEPSHGLVARNLRRMVAAAPSTVVRMTLHPDALDLVGSVRHAFDLGAPAVALWTVIEADWEGREAEVGTAFEQLADWYLEQARNGVIPSLNTHNRMLRQLDAARRGAGRPARSCRMGFELLSVDASGNVMPCHRCLHRPEDRLGTVEEAALSAARARYLSLSSDQIIGCQDCLARGVCGGSCRVPALEAGLELGQPHPHACMLTRAAARSLLRVHDTLVQEHNEPFRKMLAAARFPTGSQPVGRSPSCVHSLQPS